MVLPLLVNEVPESIFLLWRNAGMQEFGRHLPVRQSTVWCQQMTNLGPDCEGLRSLR